ncbi:MAG: hemin uptake protein HemP [Gemmataceae bacterium]|nr:hemin uptake protein HemP [Gemmataceae bacterium]
MPPDSEPSRDQPQQHPIEVDGAKVVSTEQLFAGEREIVIEHEGVRYRLRITRRNKLILQK